MTKELAQRIDSKIKAIYNCLSGSPNHNEGYGLLGGQIGKALFFTYYSDFYKHEASLTKALEIIEKASSRLGDFQNAGVSSAMPLTSIGWFISHLEKQKIVDTGAVKLLGFLDESLFNRAMFEIAANNFDQLHGALAVVNYLLQRKRNNKNTVAIEQILEKLYTLCEIDGTFVKWKGFDFKKNILTESSYNLGLAHGTPGILLILLNCYEQNIHCDRLKPIILGTVRFILSITQDPLMCGSYFPSAYEESEPTLSSRLAWCYGDLGVIYALLKANELFKLQLDEKLDEMLKFEITRKDRTTNMVFDAGFCHGTSGIAHMFHMMKRRFGTNTSAIAEYWFAKTLEDSKFADGLAGFKSYKTTPVRGYVNDSSLIEGISGIGLALISSISKRNYRWDDVFLLK